MEPGDHRARLDLESGKPTRLVSIPLSEAAGESELVLTVRDEASGRTLEAREPFRVERGGNLPPLRDLDGAQ